MSQMPQISGIPEMMEIPVAPEMMAMPSFPIIPTMRELPTRPIKMEIKQEFSQASNPYSIHEMIDRLIDGENNVINNKFIKNCNQLAMNQMADDEDDEDLSDEEDEQDDEQGVSLIGEVMVEQSMTVPDEFKQLIDDKNVTLDFSQSNYTKCKTELDKLNRCRAHFDRRVDENKGVRYVCKCCQFPAKSLESISIHLRLKHFIDN